MGVGKGRAVSSRSFDVLNSMIYDPKRKPKPKMIVWSGATFTLRWSCFKDEAYPDYFQLCANLAELFFRVEGFHSEVACLRKMVTLCFPLEDNFWNYECIIVAIFPSLTTSGNLIYNLASSCEILPRCRLPSLFNSVYLKLSRLTLDMILLASSRSTYL